MNMHSDLFNMAFSKTFWNIMRTYHSDDECSSFITDYVKICCSHVSELQSEGQM